MTIEKITSRDNRRLVHARKVRDGKVPDQIFIEGRRLVEEALRTKIGIDECLVAGSFQSEGLVEAVTERGAATVEVSDNIFPSIVDTKQPQGIVLIAKRPSSSLASIESRLADSRLPIVAFLKEVNNPANLGAILRTAEAAGIAGVIVSENSSDAFSPKALRGAMGAAFRLPIVEGVSLEDALSWAANAKLIPTAATAVDGADYAAIDLRKPRLLVLGSEAHGLNAAELDKIKERLTISMEPHVESLNLAVSAGILLFEARRQNSNG